MIVEIRPAVAADIEPIASRARRADVDELHAAARMTPASTMEFGLQAGTSTWTGLVDGEPVCMFGVVPLSLLGGVGIPWMVGTDLVERHQFAFLRHSRPCVERIRSLYDVLLNHVDDRNVVAIRWLRWLGFEFGEARPHGPDGVPFRMFQWRAGNV